VDWDISNFSKIMQAQSSPQESISTIIALLGSPSALNTFAWPKYFSRQTPHI